MSTGLFDFVDRDCLTFFYDEENITTYMPFENEEDTREDGYGERIRDKEYLICSGDKEISVYAPIRNGVRYCKVGYVDFEKEKHDGKKQIKLWYLSVHETYEGLGLGSILIAGVKHRCITEKIDTLVLDAARRYKPKGPTTEDKYPQLKDDGHTYYNANLALYQSHGFEIDRASRDYKYQMEYNFMDSNPIPMVCKIGNMVVPQSVLSATQASAASHNPHTQDGGMCQ